MSGYQPRMLREEISKFRKNRSRRYDA